MTAKAIRRYQGATEIVNSEDRQDDGQQNETKENYRTNNTTPQNDSCSFTIYTNVFSLFHVYYVKKLRFKY